ncbi:MAG: 2-oxo acid dehydrogenase subunit E2 [Pirellulales bacterium]|nr:2-oxo acid dehydrogenase subunit E2 [Pirellulales bacterium]
MAIDFKLPELGENIHSGDVVSVLVSVGDEIQSDQPVLEIETDKAVVEVPCPHSGRVTAIHVKKGDTIPIGGKIITLDGGGGDGSGGAAAAKAPEPAAKPAPAKAAPAPAEPAPAPAAKQASPPPTTAKPARAPAASARAAAAATLAPSNGGGAAPAAPSTRRLARELGVDLTGVPGTGPGGRITRDDVMAAVRSHGAAPASASAGASSEGAEPEGERDSYGPVRREPMTKIRRTIAANMAKSASTIPHVTNFDQADVTELERIRQGSKDSLAEVNIKLTPLAFVARAVALALRSHPVINASIDMEAEQLTFKEYVNLGIAVDTERGLVVPVIRGADKLSIPELAEELGIVAEKARTTTFTIDDLRGGTFTISNLGAVGGMYSTPIINHPEVAVLLVGRSKQMPVVIDGDLEVRLIMPLSLSYDHRLVDGAAAARFLNDVIALLENPGRLLFAV